MQASHAVKPCAPPAIASPKQHIKQTLLIKLACRHTEAVDVLLQNRHVDHLRPNSRQVTVTNHTGEKQRWPAGLTPLHLAAVMGHADIVAAFARHGRISAESFVVFPGSPLDAAVVGNNPLCVRVVKEFVPMNRRGFEGNTCLHMAAQCSSVDIIECLLDLGVCTPFLSILCCPTSQHFHQDNQTRLQVERCISTGPVLHCVGFCSTFQACSSN